VEDTLGAKRKPYVARIFSFTNNFKDILGEKRNHHVVSIFFSYL
jgi:hypothetical protein